MHHLDPTVAAAESEYRRRRLVEDCWQADPGGTALRRHRRRHTNRQKLY